MGRYWLATLARKVCDLPCFTVEAYPEHIPDNPEPSLTLADCEQRAIADQQFDEPHARAILAQFNRRDLVELACGYMQCTPDDISHMSRLALVDGLARCHGHAVLTDATADNRRPVVTFPAQ